MPDHKNPDIFLPHHHIDSEEILAKNIPSEDTLKKVSGILKQLCDPSRLRIFWLLCHCEECVINIAAITGMSSPAVSHHLRLLKSSGLIVSRRDGKEMYYKAAETAMVEHLHLTVENIVNISCPS
ncbi:MAG: winged helix-turn-helix transcriptional regulator [Firmicutes bacterium]|nr:winged helix-turn-helix transcriptional regulator [Bacillota bacterium]